MLTVEDGTGLSNADAYISTDDADTYHGDRNNGDWSELSTEQKEAAIRYATAWIDARFTWRGTIKEDDQALGWPRENAKDDEGRTLTGVPKRVSNACAEIALAHTSNALNAVQGPRVTSESVEGAVSVTYADTAGNQGEEYPLVEAMLRGLVIGHRNAIKVQRA